MNKSGLKKSPEVKMKGNFTLSILLIVGLFVLASITRGMIEGGISLFLGFMFAVTIFCCYYIVHLMLRKKETSKKREAWEDIPIIE